MLIPFDASALYSLFLVQSIQHLLATNKEANESHEKKKLFSRAEQMRQTTLTQCFDPPVPVAEPEPSMASGYRMIEIDGQQYLLNDTTDHLVAVPMSAEAEVSEKGNCMSPVNLASSFEVTPSATKKGSYDKNRAYAPAATAYVLSENIDSDSENEMVMVKRRKKNKNLKRKSVPPRAEARLLPSSPEVVEVIEQVEIDTQDLPKTSDFAQDGNTMDAAQEMDSDPCSEGEQESNSIRTQECGSSNSSVSINYLESQDK